MKIQGQDIICHFQGRLDYFLNKTLRYCGNITADPKQVGKKIQNETYFYIRDQKGVRTLLLMVVLL